MPREKHAGGLCDRLETGQKIRRCARAAALDAGSDESIYRGKLAAASFFAKTILPGISSTRALVENIDIDLMDVADDAF